jgi:predicted DNA-binding antitoxin AbrB/MazE fold protein
MSKKVRARYANGVLTPLEPLDLAEGTEVVLSLEGTLTAGQATTSGEIAVTPSEINEELMIEEYLEKERSIKARNG